MLLVLGYQYTYHMYRTDVVLFDFIIAVVMGVNAWLGVKAAEKEM